MDTLRPAAASPVWTARLDHLQLDSHEPERLSAFYRDVMGMMPTRLADGRFLVAGPQRRLLLGRGDPNGHPFSAWRLAHAAQLAAFRAHAAARGIPVEPSPTPLFQDDAFAVRDPDGRLAVFGIPRPESGSDARADGLPRPPARLQHAVVATTRLQSMRAFYADELGFAISDTVYSGDEGELAGLPKVHFFRADSEHHSLAVFTGSAARHDHHCYETSCWNDIRDWLDFLGERDISPWWGPGRHGPGNNLFFMIRDPDGNNIELSAELETMVRTVPPRAWPNSRRMYNLWGASWVRD